MGETYIDKLACIDIEEIRDCDKIEWLLHKFRL